MTLQEQWDKVEKFKVFEIPVIDKRTNIKEIILFDIDINGTKLEANHIGFSEKEDKCLMISFESIELDEDFSLDENLAELYDECINAIIASDYFELKED